MPHEVARSAAFLVFAVMIAWSTTFNVSSSIMIGVATATSGLPDGTCRIALACSMQAPTGKPAHGNIGLEEGLVCDGVYVWGGVVGG